MWHDGLNHSLVQIPAAALPVPFPDNVPGNAAKEGPSAWAWTTAGQRRNPDVVTGSWSWSSAAPAIVSFWGVGLYRDLSVMLLFQKAKKKEVAKSK